MKHIASLFSAKSINLGIQKFKLGAGSTWPGHIALKIDPEIIKKLLNKNPQLKIILVAGTNGKTTTSTLLKYLLEQNGIRVFQNESGANLLNGIATSLLLNAKSNGQIPYDAAIFEVDENSLPLVLKYICPTALILLNLFRDQLDRYGEVNTIALKWKDALHVLKSQTSHPTLFINGDDPGLRLLSDTHAHYFGIDEKLLSKKELSHDVDFVYCPRCQTKLKFKKIAYSHLGKYTCPKCGLTNPPTEIPKVEQYPLHGIYNIYNINAVLLTIEKIFQIPRTELSKQLTGFKPAFGRQEIIEFKNRQIMVLLSKNPAGFNRSLEVVNEFTQLEKTVIFILNDRIPDGRDISWIWDVDFEDLKATNIIVSGDRTYDIALRIKYTQNSKNDLKLMINENLELAIKKAVEITKPNETLFILPTYSAMLEARKILLGRKIL
jgi:UDP-N-acetylmuramyl tripeptide synthase